MSTGSDIADEYISDLNFGAAELLQDEIDAAIAAAVAAEREACAIEAHHVIYEYFDLADTRRTVLANKVSSAIRARV